MSDLTRYATAVLVVLCGVSISSPAQQPAVKSIPSAVISGRVTIDGNGVPGIVVGVRSAVSAPGPSLSVMPTATTDENGTYRISKLPPGHYLVLPVAPAFVLPGINYMGQRGKPVVIGKGEQVSGIDFTMERGGVITGKVTDTEGRPIIEERVHVVVAGAGDPSPTYLTDFRTDDRGIYRIFGLQAGSYRVAVGEAQAGIPGGPGRTRVKRTFHPDTFEEANAVMVELRAGEEKAEIDITVSATLPSLSVAGRVVDGETGVPVPGVRFRLARVSGGRYWYTSPRGDPANEKGEFRIEGLTSGSYQISVDSQPGVAVISEEVQFEIRDQSVTDLLIKTAQGGSISGVVVLEGAVDKNTRERLQQMRLSFFVRREGMTIPIVASAVLKPDGSFQVTGLRDGVVGINASVPNRLDSLSIARVERNGIAQPPNLPINPGEHISDLKIVIGVGSGVLRGVVTFENGSLPVGGRVSLSLRRLDDSSFVNLRTPEVDARGHFVIQGLRSGSYTLTARLFVPGRRGSPIFGNQQLIINDGTVTETLISLDLSALNSPNP